MLHGRSSSAIRRVLGATLVFGAALVGGCHGPQPKPYTQETHRLFLPGSHAQVWAIAPTLNISGEKQVDPLLQSDLVFQELQGVAGLTVVPVNRVAEVYASLKIDKIESEKEAFEVCDLLGCDALVVPAVTAYDPYDPPKLGASLQVFIKPGAYEQTPRLDVHDLQRSPTPEGYEPMAAPHQLVQAVGIFDAAQGSVRIEALDYSKGRSDPNAPMGERIVFMSMDRYCGFVYHELIADVINQLTPARS